MPMMRYVKGIVKKATNEETRQLVICREKGEVKEDKPLDDDEDRDTEDRDEDSDSSRAD
jgi:hypothetical protein